MSCHFEDLNDYEGVVDPSYIYTAKFADDGEQRDLLALGNEDGYVLLQVCFVFIHRTVLTFWRGIGFLKDTTDIGSSNNADHFQAHNNAIFDLAWAPKSRVSLKRIFFTLYVAMNLKKSFLLGKNCNGLWRSNYCSLGHFQHFDWEESNRS